MSCIKNALLVFCVVFCFYLVQSKPWEPEPRPDQEWIDRHNQFVQNSKINGSNIKIVFTGSSVCEYWSTTGKAIWDAKYAPLGAVNYGIGWDQIQHCLWRVQNGELDNINPKLLVMYCGSHNIPDNPNTDEIVRGITETLEEVGRRLPQTKILYVTINPRGDISPAEQMWTRISKVNTKILQLNNGDNRTVFSMFNDFANSWGNIKQEFYVADKLHLNADGYALWDRLWNETFFRLLNS